MQIINDSTFGGRVGESIGNALQQLAHNKVQHLEREYAKRQESQQRNDFAQLLQGGGYDKKTANILAYLAQIDPKGLREYMSAISPQGQQAQSLMQQMGQPAQQPNIQPQQQNIEPLRQLLQQAPQAQQSLQQLGQVIGQNPAQLYQSMQDNQGLKNVGKKDLTMPGLKLTPKSPVKAAAKQALQQQPGIAPEGQQPQNFAQALSSGASAKELAKSRKEANKEAQPFIKDTLKAERSAKDSDKRLNRMLAIAKKGGLPNATFNNFLTSLEETSPSNLAAAGAALGGRLGAPAGLAGILGGVSTGAIIGGAAGALAKPIVSLIKTTQREGNPDIEEFEKLSSEFIRDAKGIFGARITDADLAAFMKTVPTLANTDAGKQRIINNLQLANEATHVRTKVMNDLIKENGGYAPMNLDILVEEISDPILDSLAKKFVEGSQETKEEKDFRKNEFYKNQIKRNLGK